MSSEIIFQNWWKNKNFLRQTKTGNVTSRSALQGMLKKILQGKGKWNSDLYKEIMIIKEELKKGKIKSFNFLVCNWCYDNVVPNNNTSAVSIKKISQDGNSSSVLSDYSVWIYEVNGGDIVRD
jgi:hypothetical protein